MAADRLSALPDRALTRVLSFLDVRDASRTGILSRRWRTLWRQGDAVNLYDESHKKYGYDGEKAGKHLFTAAVAAVRAGGRCPVRKLSVVVHSCAAGTSTITLETS
ncbi:unnamed protein product [Urochloa humidicola]